MINLSGPRWIIFHHVKEQWICCDQSPSGILFIVEPDYLPNSYVGQRNYRIHNSSPPPHLEGEFFFFFCNSNIVIS
jgi:hypothetical protein